MISTILNERIDFEDIFKFSPDFICIASRDGYFKKVNPMVMQTLGYSPEELLDKPIKSFIHLDDQASTALKFGQVASWLNCESRYITKSGEIIWVNWTSTPLESQHLILAIGKNTTLKNQKTVEMLPVYTAADQFWLSKFESVVRKYVRKIDLNLNMICDELAIGERQLFRRIRTIAGVTPNQFVRKIRLQIAMEAIQSGKYRTISEISYVAGFRTPNYFKKLFENSYNVEIEHLL